MKKRLFAILTVMILTSTVLSANAINDKEVVDAIKLYKAGNYAECYTSLKEYVKKDSSNVLAYYYLAISSAQAGRKNEAISNYSKVLSLSSKNSNISRYAARGKMCLETPDKCNNALFTSASEAFILGDSIDLFSEEAKGKYEQLKIENLMREMNRSNDISPEKFKEYRDFSSSSLIPSLLDNNEWNQNSISPKLIQAMLTNNMTLGF